MINEYLIGMIKIASSNVYTLFDPGATHSFIATSFIKKTKEMSPTPLENNLCVRTPSREVILVNSICKDCVLSIEDREMKADLLVLEMKDFDLILGMDWLAAYHATVYY